MRALSRCLARGVLLPLILFTFGFGPGGWFCASGTPCEPREALSCCCGENPAPPRDPRCDEDSDRSPEKHATVSALPCGCYYAAPAVDGVLHSALLALDLVPALPPAPFAAPAAPVAERGFHAPQSERAPPRFLLCAGPSRAPPAT